MIDTLNIQLDNTKFDYNHIQSIFEKKMEFKAATRFKNGNSTTVHYHNYKFTLSERNLTATGSLCKLYYGNNLQTLNFDELQLALTKFETLFEIPFDDAKIRRIDVGACLQMEMPVNLYLDLLTTPSNYKLRLYEAETKSFEGSKVNMCFYNKVEETRKNDRSTYSAFQHDNILKYEVRLSKNIAKNLNIQDFCFKDLYDFDMYKKLLDLWKQSYYQIPKLTIMLPSQLNFTSLSAYKDSVIMQRINSLGGKEVLLMSVNQARIKKNVKHLIKKYLTEIGEVEPLSPLLQAELDSKINKVYDTEIRLLSE